MGAGFGGSAGAGQGLDGSRMLGERGKPSLGSAGGHGESQAWGPGWEDQGSGSGSIGSGDWPPGSRASSSLQGDDATYGGIREGPEGSWGWEGAPGGKEASGGQSAGFLDGRASGLGRSQASGPGDSGVPGKGAFGRASGSTSKPGDSGRQGAWDGPGGPSRRKDSGDGAGSGGTGGPGAQPGRGWSGGRGSLGEQASLEAEGDGAPGPDALWESEGGAVEESGGSERRLGPYRSRTQTWSRVEGGAAKRGGADEARGPGPPGAEDRDAPGELPSHPEGRRDGREGESDILSQRDAARSPRSRHKPGAGGFSREAGGKCPWLCGLRGGATADSLAPRMLSQPTLPPAQDSVPAVPPVSRDLFFLLVQVDEAVWGSGPLCISTPHVQSPAVVEPALCGSPGCPLCVTQGPLHLP